MRGKKSKNQSEAAKTVCEILSCFNSKSEELGITEIARELGMYTSKVHRVASTLETFGILERNPVTRKYRIGLRLFEMGTLYPINLSIRRIVRPHALELAKALDTNLHLGIMSKSIPYSVVIIDRVINVQSHSTIQRISFNIPLHSSSLGKVLLAFSERGFIELVLRDIELQKFTSSTITDRSRLEEELRLVRERGYATDREETHSNLYCVAAPIRDHSGIVAAISISDHRQKIEKRQDEIIARITDTAEVISYQLGH